MVSIPAAVVKIGALFGYDTSIRVPWACNVWVNCELIDSKPKRVKKGLNRVAVHGTNGSREHYYARNVSIDSFTSKKVPAHNFSNPRR